MLLMMKKKLLAKHQIVTVTNKIALQYKTSLIMNVVYQNSERFSNCIQWELTKLA